MGGGNLEELYHYGILGMKWGVRRFQNEDGSYTAAGKRRYDKGDYHARTKKQKTSHRDKLITKYREKGMGQTEAEQAADKRIDFEKKVAIGAGVAVGVLAVYGAYRCLNEYNTIRPWGPWGRQYKLKTFESSDFTTQIDDDLRKINREGMAGHILLRGRSVNCSSCSMAYEMRRRGYDVVAGRVSTISGGRSDEEMASFFIGNNKFRPLVTCAANESLNDIGDSNYYRDLERYLTRQGEGARGILNGYYPFGGGHSIAYEINGGKVIYVDGQIGRRYKDVTEALGLMNQVNYLRTDNLELADSAAQTVLNNDAASLISELPSGLTVASVSAVGYGAAKRRNRKKKQA